MLGSILNIKLKDKVTINKIKSKTNCKDIGYHIKKLKFKYTGHKARGDKNQVLEPDSNPANTKESQEMYRETTYKMGRQAC